MYKYFFLAVGIVGLLIAILAITKVLGDSESSIIGGIIGGSVIVTASIIGWSVMGDYYDDKSNAAEAAKRQ